MEKELKFKKEWFDVLNRFNLSHRTEVIEAVFQYVFTGAEPAFEDEARTLSFGFIYADIDATRIRREKRKARKAKTEEPQTTEAPRHPNQSTSNARVKKWLCSLIHQWSDIVSTRI